MRVVAFFVYRSISSLPTGRGRGRGCYQFLHLVLPDVEVRRVIEHGAPLPDELPSVTLSSRAPHGRALRLVEHTQLDGTEVGDHTHAAAQGIHLAHYLSLGNAAHGRVTRHLCNLVHVHRDETGLRTHPRRCVSRLTTGVAAAYYDNVVI